MSRKSFRITDRHIKVDKRSMQCLSFGEYWATREYGPTADAFLHLPQFYFSLSKLRLSHVIPRFDSCYWTLHGKSVFYSCFSTRNKRLIFCIYSTIHRSVGVRTARWLYPQALPISFVHAFTFHLTVCCDLLVQESASSPVPVSTLLSIYGSDGGFIDTWRDSSLEAIPGFIKATSSTAPLTVITSYLSEWQ